MYWILAALGDAYLSARIFDSAVERDYSDSQDLDHWNIYRLQYPNIVFDTGIKVGNLLVLRDIHMRRLYHGKQTVAPSLVVFLIYWGLFYHKTSKRPDNN